VKLELTFWVGRWIIDYTPDIDEQKILKKNKRTTYMKKLVENIPEVRVMPSGKGGK
jgi:hypothetical protein